MLNALINQTHSTAHMNFFKRATTSILRRPGKTIILLLLVFILGSVIAGAISVEGAISNTDANLRRSMQPIASISEDWENWHDREDVLAAHERINEITANFTDEDWRAADWEAIQEEAGMPYQGRLMPDIIRAIGRLPEVKFYDFTIQSSLQSLELEEYTGDQDWGRMEGDAIWITMRGTSSTDMVHFNSGNFQLIQGRQFENQDLEPGSQTSHIIVSAEFANKNNLSIGSIVTLSEFITFPDENGEMWWGWGPEFWAEENIYAQVGLDFEIIGLFDVPALEDDSDPWSQESHNRISSLNSIFTPNWALEDIMRRAEQARITVWDATDVERPEWMGIIPDEDEREETQFHITPLFLLNDPDDVESFIEAANEYLPSDFWQLEFRSGGFDDISSSMETMQTIANWVLYVSIGATLLILSLLITLFLRDRRYEMGVYLALGEKKGRIISQILLEVVVTSFVAITFSVFVGHIISGQVSQNMLMNQLTAETNDDPWGGGWRDWDIFDQIGIPSQDMSIDEMLEAYDVSLTPRTIGMFYVIGLGAVIISSLVPVIYIVTLNPKKVLM